MKKQILLIIFALLISFNSWATNFSMVYKDGDTFTAFIPLNGNDSVEMTFHVISEKDKTISVGDSYGESGGEDWLYHDPFAYHEYESAVSSSVEGVIIIPPSINGYMVTKIGYNAFNGCNFSSITVPETVNYICKRAFGNCPKVIIPCSTKMTDLDFYGGECEYWPANAYVDAFSTDCKIYVPSLLLNAYKNNLIWKSVANQLYPIESDFDYDISVQSQEQGSVLNSIIGEEFLGRVVSLKLSGAINGYDIKVIREKMPFLRRLDLTDVNIIANDYPYYTDENGNSYHTENNVLGDYCFANMTDLQDIQLPRNIKKIGNHSFLGCKALLTIKLPKRIESIGDLAFQGCNLKNVKVIDSEPILISSSSFPNRENMTLVILEGNKDSYISSNYWKDFKEIVDSTDYIHFTDKNVEIICLSYWHDVYHGLFSWDTNEDGVLSKEEAVHVESIADVVGQWFVSALDSRFLESDITSFDELKFFTGLTDIPGWTFYDCNNLSSIIIPENVVSIGGGYSSFGPTFSSQEASISTWKRRDELGAFNGCSNLASITIPKKVKHIEEFAFEGCDNLKEVQISDLQSWMNIDFGNWSANPLSYAHHLFLDNQEVKNIQIPEDMTSIKKYVFSGCEGLTSVSLPNSITSIGDGAFRGCINVPSISIPENLTSIGIYAFQNCSSISSLQIPKGITELPRGVFADCSQLTSVEIPSNVIKIGGYTMNFDDFFQCFCIYDTGVFEGCSSLTTVNLPESVTNIGVNSFKGCSSLVSVIIPESVTEIQSGAFEGCSSLKSINFPGELRTQFFSKDRYYDFENVLEEPYNGIGSRMFYGCSSLTSITLPECVDSIGENAFYGCDNLTFVKVKRPTPFNIDENTFPTRANIPLYVPLGSGELYRTADYWKEFKEIIEVENIDDYVQGEIFTVPVDLDNGKKVIMTFKVIDAAKKTVQVGDGDDASIVASTEGGLIIPDKVNGYTVTKIGSYAFYYCSNLTSVSIPNTVKTFGNRAFYVCSGLTSLHISASVTSIEDRAFAYCSRLEEIIVDEGNTVYDSRNDCNALIKTSDNTLLIGCKGTVIPSSVKVLAEGAFRGCAELKNIEIPEGVTTIGASTFRGCTGLESVTLPSTISSIGTYAFSAFDEVYNLTTVTVGMTNPVTITSSVFPNRANSTLYVPKGSKAAYKAANYWKEFKQIIEIGETVVITDISDMDNAFYMDEKSVVPGNRYVLPIKLKNSQLVMGYQFDLELPEGVSFALDDKGRVIATMSDRGNGFSIGKNKRSDHVCRFVVINASNNVLTGEDGVVMNVTVDVADDMEAGAYGVVFKNGELTTMEDNAVSSVLLQNVTAPLNVVAALLGDVNNDGKVSVTDAVAIIGCVLGNENSNFLEVAADVNCDGSITIADVVNVINLILNDNSYSKANGLFDAVEE